jgi:site-specific recombinase XerD
MAKANFYLKPRATENGNPIFMLFSFGGRRLKYYANEKANPKHWNKKRQRVSKSATGAKEINLLLDKIEQTAQKAYRDFQITDIDPTTEELREALDKALLRSHKGLHSFDDYLDHFIAVNGVTKKPKTIQKYKTLRKHIAEFEAVTKYKVSFRTVTSTFYDKFVAYLLADRNMINNSIGKYIATLKRFMRWATEKGFNENLAFLKFKVMTEETDIITLTENELATLFHFDLSENERLGRIRDLLCFACATGLRFSDLVRITKDTIQGDAIVLRTTKTKDQASIPITTFARAILNKYDNNLPSISNQNFNKYVKELGKAAGINERITQTQYQGANSLSVTKPKYELLSSHTGRRTFVTLSLEKGMRPEIVMKITGHKDYATFKKYIKLTDKVKQEEMNRAWDVPLLKVV